MNPWSYDTVRQELTVGTSTCGLRGREAEAFGYLVERAGTVVSRKELEREVWGFRGEVRSETVPVTIRNLRKRMPVEMRFILRTVRGVGWSVVVAPTATQRSMPQFHTPMFHREDELEAIEQLWKDGWNVLTLVGPGGMGKTRLVVAFAETLNMPVAFVEVGACMDAAGLERRIAAACGVSARGLAAVHDALATNPMVVVFDEAERLATEVSQAIEQLGQRVLVTSRHELDRPDEAVHAVAPLHGKPGREFARARLRASRWGHSADDATLDALVDLMDGLPLGVEVAAAQAMPPGVLVETLQAGRAIPGSPLEHTLEASCADLSPAARDVLHTLTLLPGPISEADLVAWLGANALTEVIELGRHSLVHREEAGWRLLRTLRRFLKDRPWDDRAPRERLDAFLVERSERAAEQLFHKPVRELLQLAPLVEPMLELLERVHERNVATVFWPLWVLAHLQGPIAIGRSALKVAMDRAGSDPLVRMIAALYVATPDTEAYADAFASADAQQQTRGAIVAALDWLPRHLEIPAFTTPPNDTPLEQMQRAYCEARSGHIISTPSSSFRLMQLIFRELQTRSLFVRGANVDEQWQALMAEMPFPGIPGMRLRALSGYVDSLLLTDRDRAMHHLRSLAEQGVAFGHRSSWLMGRVGLMMALLGAIDEAMPWLVGGSQGRDPPTATVCRVAHTCLLTSACTPELHALPGVLFDGTRLSALIAGIVILHLGAPGEAPPPSTPILRALHHSANRLD